VGQRVAGGACFGMSSLQPSSDPRGARFIPAQLAGPSARYRTMAAWNKARGGRVYRWQWAGVEQEHAMTDRAAFEQTALVHMDAAYNLAFWLLRDRADADDAVQDAYLRAFRAFHQLAGASVKPWLLTIVRNVCYRRLQDRSRMGNVISFDEAIGPRPGGRGKTEFASAARSPEQEAVIASDQVLLTQAIEALAPIYREVIALREIEDLSYREIADVIGAPVGTVMSRLSRARLELRGRVAKLMELDDSDAL
jgi:RNA polymerase sigma factor (sigma-70 family)